MKEVIIAGEVMYINHITGSIRTVKVKPFKLPADTQWVDVVDEALERHCPQNIPEEEEWEYYDDSGVTETLVEGAEVIL